MGEAPRLRLRGKIWHVCIGRSGSRSLRTTDRRVAELRAQEYAQDGLRARVTAEEAAARFMGHLRAKRRTAGTQAYYATILDWLRSGMEPLPLHRWNRAAFEALLDRAQREGLPRRKSDSPHANKARKAAPWSAETARKVIRAARAWIAYARKMGLDLPDFVGDLEAPAREYVEPVAFTREESAGILLEADDGCPAFRRLIYVESYTGMDVADARALTWAAVNLKAGEIRFRRTKTRQPVTVPIHADLRAVLLETPARKRRGVVCAGLPQSASSLRQRLARLLKRAEVGEAPRGHRGWRRFRHTFATRLVEAGATVPDVRALMGHHPTSPMPLRYFRTDAGRLRDFVDGGL